MYHSGPQAEPLLALVRLGQRRVDDHPLDKILNRPSENYAPPDAIPLDGTQESLTTVSVLHGTPMEDVQPSPKPQKTRKKRKRGENFLDERTEFTSDELKEMRETYLQRQDILRSEMEVKRKERDAALLFDRLLWAAPHDSEVFLPCGRWFMEH